MDRVHAAKDVRSHLLRPHPQILVLVESAQSTMQSAMHTHTHTLLGNQIVRAGDSHCGYANT